MPNSNNYDLIERIPAGYVMNTIELASRVRLVTGLRIEATHVDTTELRRNTLNTLTYKAGGDYTNILPSASLRFALDKDSDLAPGLRPRLGASRSAGYLGCGEPADI